MIDGHLHLDDEKLRGQAEEIIRGLSAHGIEFVINNSCNYRSMLDGANLAEKFDDVYATVGMHPHDSKDFDDCFRTTMRQLASSKKVVAVGEIGLDYYYDLSDRQTQKDVFAEQLEIADELNLPVTLHIRDAYKDAADILTAQKKYLNNGVLWHCYSGSAEFARQMAKQGHYFAFGGAITFKNAHKEDVLREVPFDRVLSETDSPYMAPVPLRGTVNTPFNIPLIVAKIAEIYGKSIDETEAQIRENTLRLFSKIKR
ncbi:MAG: TatD family hydrolase [Corallococcus sp.]|nr:TatD family hydrolase [Bacillota bacterium]MCM1533306.1 TatD family hydrolase [Corallococcus sp.]